MPLYSFIIMLAILTSCHQKAASAPDTASQASIREYMKARNYTAIPLTHNSIGHLTVKAVVNGDTVVLVLDSGASGTCFENKSAKKLGIVLNGAGGGATGYGGAEESIKEGFITLTMGKFIIKDLSIAAIDLSHINNAYSAQGNGYIDGVLGADVLSRYHAVIDYSSATLFLKN